SYQTLERPPAAADTGGVHRATLLLLALLTVSAAACGSGGARKLGGPGKGAGSAPDRGRPVVSSVSCHGHAPPANQLPGGGSVHAEHTCTVDFKDGQRTQVWAVHVLDLVLKDQVQLLYRVDHNGGGDSTPAVDVAKSFSAQMAVLKGGAAVTH